MFSLMKSISTRKGNSPLIPYKDDKSIWKWNGSSSSKIESKRSISIHLSKHSRNQSLFSYSYSNSILFHSNPSNHSLKRTFAEEEEKKIEEEKTPEEKRKEAIEKILNEGKKERNIAQYYGFSSMEEMQKDPTVIELTESVKNDNEIVRFIKVRVIIGSIIIIAIVLFLSDALFRTRSEDPIIDPYPVRQAKEKHFYTSLYRSFSAIRTAFSIVWDYRFNSLEVKDPNYEKVKSDIHKRSANKILQLCKDLGGFYILIGQIIASSPRVPKEYSKELYFLRNESLFMGEGELRDTFLNIYGIPIDAMFSSFKYKPVSHTSTYQVHHALLGDKAVNVKIQYPEIQEEVKEDLKTISFIVKCIKRFFPKFDDAGLLNEIQESAKLQTNFLKQGDNARDLADIFEGDTRVKIPLIYRRYCKPQSLVSEFCKGFQLSENDGIRALGFTKAQVQQLTKIIPSKLQKTPDPSNLLIWKDFQTGKPIVVLSDFEFYSDQESNSYKTS